MLEIVFQEAIVELRKNLSLSKNGPSPVYKANDCQRNICVLLGCLAEKLAGKPEEEIRSVFDDDKGIILL